MSSHSFYEETSSVSETSSGNGTHAESTEGNTDTISSNTSLRQEHQASSGNGMQSEGTITDKSQGQPIRTSNGSSLKVCTNSQIPNGDTFNEESAPAEETKRCYNVKFSARTSQDTRVYDQNAPEANLVGNDVPSTSKFEVPDHSNTASEIQELMSEQVGAQAGEQHATLHTDLGAPGAVDVRGKVGIAGPSRNDTSVPHEKYNTKESKVTGVAEPHDSFPAPSADVRTENIPEHQPSEDEEDQPPPVLTRNDKEAVTDQTEKLVDAEEGEKPESIGTEPQGLEDEPRGTGQPLEDEVSPQMEEENRLSDGSEDLASTTTSAPGESVENVSLSLLMPTGAPEVDARQQDYDNSARAENPTSGSRLAAQVPVSPADEAQSLGKVESETLVDVTQPEQSCPNSDADELLEERNDDVSQNFNPPDADVPLSTTPSAPGKSVENASQPLLMPAAAPQMDARQQDYDNTAGAGSPTSVSQPVPLSTTPSASGESVENAFQSLLMPTGAPEEDARQQDHDNSARARSPTSGSQPVGRMHRRHANFHWEEALYANPNAVIVKNLLQSIHNSLSLRTIADHVVDLQRTTILPFAQQIYNGLLDAPPELSSLDSMRLISEHFSNRYRTIIIPRVQEVYRDFLNSSEQIPLEKRSVDRTRNCNALHIPNPGSQASDFVNGINNNIEFVDLESISEHLINRDRTTIIPMAREVYQALLQYPEQELPVPRAFVDDEEAETRDEERAFNDDTQM